jgi:hypothetical protein
MLKGIRDQLKSDGSLKNGCFGVQVADDDEEIERQIRGPAQGYSGEFKDDLTGQVLQDSMVKAARSVELTYFNPKKVWSKVPRQKREQRLDVHRSAYAG